MRRLLVVTVALFVSVAAGAKIPNDDTTIAHVLNRIGFGPRPGDVERVRAFGLERYIDQQLHPERIPDTPVTARLSGLTTLAMSSREIADQIARPALEARRDKKKNAEDAKDAEGTKGAGNDDRKPQMPTPEQRAANRVMVDLSEQKVLRAVYSERQLQEVLTDFWFNHFNVDARKGQDRFMLTAYERDAIRPHVLGSFRDLLGATAKSPAMLFYLDNWMSVDPNGPHQEPRMTRRGFVRPRPAQSQPQQGANARRGLNENYGRELMELHTLGVDGGYTQKDVTEVARAFTGWTIDKPRQGGDFIFNPRLHDDREKVLLGHTIKAGGGISDGEQVLDILAKHPSTARFIATKLVRRFVSDTPPPALVDRTAARFRETNGNLREVMRTILTSREFLSPDAYRAKVKTPFEFVVSALRATNAEVSDAQPVVRTLQQLGMPLYQCQPPTGYKDTADAWVNTGALVGRMNFAVALSSNRLPRTSIGNLDALRDLLDEASEATRDTIAKASSPQQMAALTLGSPEFQRR
jgi:uncharacterized protein (DUF1800 family)